ncbi:D-alanyl-D-alanine carboxypeptidase/D-alanyl-D-alanine endopeptidase [Neolewinella antarctica]|uniref:D-alanyl-D-alanine carboxypeptidase/D-alanyl-D-alanine-endopeptidase (Penicillin-binding protein 4) n=1 Tax=Neolewinella antarctica TaxID=442734 RepID=A0ABX0XCX5_9BACT|nr:D-alanyl-D-alanine carboxypeptidase/D-alanyl-D-alanine-endopeptidase [Neolewinella antarctica]NJC27146.1 D-alanyl-D-alanine carboxypeptidase/D-alanyl-D-alanine-endopeptidase (penicillin-binding protein 4) [Neolewinella antarctica]
MKQALILLCYLCLAAPVAAQFNLADRVYAFATHPELRGAQVGIDVRDVRTGDRVAAFQPYTALIPASTLKLITTAAAYDVLGADHVFTTDLVISGEIDNGTLRGNVYIIGGGDPTLGSPYMKGVPRTDAVLERWAEALARAGVRRIEGRVVGDGSYYGTNGVAAEWPWSDLGNYYGAGAYGLNLNENSYKLDLLQRKVVGTRPVVQGTRPRVPGLTITSELTSGPKGSGDQAYIYAAPFGREAIVRGSIPIGSKRFTIRGSVPDPALFAADALTERLAQRGITTSLPPETHRTVGGGRFLDTKLLDRYTSPPLTEIIDRTNLRSLNLYAEALLREVGKARGVATDDLSGTETIINWLQTLGLSTAGMQVMDGSGLATRNFFSPALMTSFLRTQASNERWRQSIPVAGRTGSMRNFLQKRTAAGRLAAKSGSLNAVNCYAGYATGPDGRELAFAIMVNNHVMESRRLRNLMLELMDDICGEALP